MALRDAAVRKGLHVSEYGVLDDATGETHRCATEHEVYALLGLEYIEPELRENRGELEAAAAGTLPDADRARRPAAATCTRHTTASDGTASIEEMAARGAGLRLRVPGDHRPLGELRVRRRGLARAAARADRAHPRRPSVDGIQLLAGSEVNILPDGSLDYADELLAELDWVIASVHSSFRMSADGDDRPDRARDRASAGRRDRPPVGAQARAAARPTQFDLERVIEAAARTGTMLEINSNPDRRDLNETTPAPPRRPASRS